MSGYACPFASTARYAAHLPRKLFQTLYSLFKQRRVVIRGRWGCTCPSDSPAPGPRLRPCPEGLLRPKEAAQGFPGLQKTHFFKLLQVALKIIIIIKGLCLEKLLQTPPLNARGCACRLQVAVLRKGGFCLAEISPAHCSYQSRHAPFQVFTGFFF